jgi:predicted dienelactone hydrolase
MHSVVRAKHMASATPIRKLLPSIRQDYIRRHQIMRRVTNATLVVVLSGTAGYFITVQPKSAFSLPDGGPPKRASLATSPEKGAAEPTSTASSKQPIGYALPAGPYTVAEVPDTTLRDQKRNKDLHVRVFYPERPGKYPVIVFSHGAGGSQTCCDALTRHWASYGYVTVQPTHDDSREQRQSTGTENVRFLQAVRDALHTPTLWESRPRDISLVVDSLPALQDRFPQLAGKLDADHIGVGGHSMGAFTSEAIAGATVDLPGHPAIKMADHRVKAVLCLSPQGPGQFGLTERSFEGISLPYLGITGTLDSLGPSATAAWHKVPFDRSRPGDKYEVLIQGANHMSFVSPHTTVATRAEQSQLILGYTNSAALAFWDAYLKNDPAAKSYLESEALEKESHQAVKVDRR